MAKSETEKVSSNGAAGESMDWMRDVVPVRVPMMPGDGEPAVITAGVNGVTYAIPRGVDVLLPRAIVEVLRNAIQHTWAMPAQFPLQGLKYLGKHPRFYVLDLPSADGCVPLKPIPPMGSDEIAELQKVQVLAATEAAAAEAELRSATPHPALSERHGKL